MSPLRYRVVLFDLDGTLTDSESGIVASYQYALGQIGREAPVEAIRRGIGPPLPDSMRALGIPEAQVDELVDLYRAYFAREGIFDNRLYPGVSELLHDLDAEGAVIGLTTSKLGHFAVRILEHFGVRSHFSAVVGATRDGRLRHKEDIVAEALLELGDPPPASVVVVGDREHDVFAARHHGVDPIGVTWGYGSVAELRSAGAEILVGSVEELGQALRG